MRRELLTLINDCQNEIHDIKAIITSSPLSATTPFLTKYALIKATGTMEQVFKSTIANYFDRSRLPQVHNFINKNIRLNPCNPKYNLIIKMLAEYDDSWKSNFQSAMNTHRDFTRINASINSLVDARNAFSHGGNPSITITNVEAYFNDAIVLLRALDASVR